MLSKSYFPVFIDSASCKILIVGGGKIALQKLKNLVKFKARITVVAKEPLPRIVHLGHRKKICLMVRRFTNSDLAGHQLIYACTDNLALNHRIEKLAKKKKLLVNVADDHRRSSFISPAVYKKRKLIIAVSTSGLDPGRSAHIRNSIKNMLREKSA
ncbi:MAG: bifunctional precorrin-2 dehydrogenase/sirohydrochlorin ferrochelatase [Candidatus Omnitrophota bacterium]